MIKGRCHYFFKGKNFSLDKCFIPDVILERSACFFEKKISASIYKYMCTSIHVYVQTLGFEECQLVRNLKNARLKDYII